MRASVVFLCVMVVAALGLCVVSVSAQPPPPQHESLVILFNDSSCTQHIRTERIPEPSSTACQPERYRERNMSAIFTCTSVNNVTTLAQSLFNDTTTCSGTPIESMTSTAPEHTCAAINVQYEGMKATLYGHIECAPPNATRAQEERLNLRQLVAVGQANAAAQQATEETSSPFHTVKSMLARLF